jgi:hypothetical protein
MAIDLATLPPVPRRCQFSQRRSATRVGFDDIAWPDTVRPARSPPPASLSHPA